MITSECQKIEKIKTKEKLNQVFKLKLKGVHQISIWLIVIYIASFSVILLLSSLCITVLLILIILIICVLLFDVRINIVLFIIISIRFYRGDTNKYISFLKC